MNKGVLDKINRESGMKAPEGYFDNLHDRVMQNLPEKEIVAEQNTPVSFWTMAKPWFYMAAMFAGIALMFKVFTLTTDNQESAIVETKIENEDDIIEDFIFYNNITDFTIYECYAEGN